MLLSILLLVTFLVVIGLLRKPKKDHHSNWAQLLSGFKYSTKDFYKLVRDEMNRHDVTGLSFEQVHLKTGNAFSAERLYLRVKWREYHYDICFAPFGDGCFVSWWLIYENSDIEVFLAKLPFIGEWIRKAFFKKTYYQIDTASMFMTFAQHSVLAVIDEITKISGIRLSEDERKPILNNIFLR